MTKNAFLFYHRCDDNMFETCVKTLRKNSDCVITVVTDNFPLEMQEIFSRRYRINWINVLRERVTGRRAACKIEELEKFVTERCVDEDVVFVCDVDMYFLADPFTAFEESEFDLGLTTRGYKYPSPINGGTFCVVCNEKSREWLKWHVSEIHNATWKPYAVLNKVHRKRFGLDWAVGQDFLIACWQERNRLEEISRLVIKDVGNRYNYCPPSDRWQEKAFEAIRTAYRQKSVAVLHLKSTLKDILYENLFEDAVISYPRCSHDWFGAGKKT